MPWQTTFYAPGAGGLMEGPWATSRRNPVTNAFEPFTLDDVRLRKSPWVTVASDPSRYGQTLNLGSVTYRSPLDQQTYTLPNVQGYVHDTGSAFRGRPDKIDIAQGDFRGWNPITAENFVAGGNAASPEGSPGGRRMPQNFGLMDMFNPAAYQARDITGEPTDFGNALAGRSNTLIGLGLGLMQPGGNPWGQALRGYQAGAAADARAAEDARDFAFRQQQANRLENQWKKEFGLKEQQFQEQGWTPGVYEDTETEQKYPYQQNRRTGETRWLFGSPPGLAGGATAAAPSGGAYSGGAPVPFVGGGPMGTGTGGGFPQQQQQLPRDAVVMPNGEVITPPPGLPPSARKEWRKHMIGIQADAAAGKMTEQQSNSTLFASRMELAERALQGGADAIGTHPGYRATEKVPFGLGNYAQNEPYQNYRIARDNFINGYLRRISGATIRDDEFLREERNFFPQPGDGPQAIEDKRILRAAAIANMKRGAGPGYQSPELPSIRERPPQTAGSNAAGGSRVQRMFEELIKRGVKNPDQ